MTYLDCEIIFLQFFDKGMTTSQLCFPIITLEISRRKTKMINVIRQEKIRGSKEGVKISRLNFLKSASILSVSILTGCSQIKFITGNYPDKFKDETDLNDRILRAFVTVVIPGADERNPNLTKIFTDEYYPFKPFCAFFISDLCSKSMDLFGNDEFHSLNESQKKIIVEAGLNGDSMIERLYTAAVFMSQVSYYSGIYDDGAGCKLINFDGSNSGYTDEEMFYPDAEKYLALQITETGNYN